MLSGTPALSKEILSFDPPPVASQQSTTEVVTLRRQGDASALAQPLQVHITTQTSLTSVTSPALAGVQYQGVDQVVTFLPGQSSGKLTIPIIHGAPNPGLLSFRVSAVASSRANVVGGQATVYLAAKADVSTPTIVSARLLRHGSVATGIVLTFSQPMDAATAEKVAAYSVTVPTKRVSAGDVFKFVFFARTPKTTSTVAIQSAHYDPATNSVTLTPVKPLNATANYTVANSSTKAPGAKARVGLPGTSTIARPLIGLDGNLINDRGNGTAGLFQVKAS